MQTKIDELKIKLANARAAKADLASAYYRLRDQANEASIRNVMATAEIENLEHQLVAVVMGEENPRVVVTAGTDVLDAGRFAHDMVERTPRKADGKFGGGR